MAGSYKGIWKKRVLLPLWIVQLLALVVMLGITALAFGVWNRVQDDVNNYPELSDEVGDTDTFNKAVEYVLPSQILQETNMLTRPP